MKQIMDGVREYAEEMPVELRENSGRLVIVAYNEAGYNRTEIDALDLLDWLREHRPELFR